MDFLGAGVVDEVLARGGCGDERGDGGVVEGPGQPVGDPVQPGDRVIGEQRLVAVGQLQVMPQVGGGLGEVHRLGVLEALIRQAGSLVALARGQVAAPDPEVVAAQLAEAEAARRRAEARAVTAEARAAEAGQEMLAALEAAEAAYRGREAAEAEARRAHEETITSLLDQVDKTGGGTA
jgi:hypothetical protein